MAHKRLSYTRFLLLALLGIFMLTANHRGFGQDTNASLGGTVQDPNGAAIPNAKVTVTNLGTTLSVSTTTNSNGNFTVRELPVGTYKLVAEA